MNMNEKIALYKLATAWMTLSVQVYSGFGAALDVMDTEKMKSILARSETIWELSQMLLKKVVLN